MATGHPNPGQGKVVTRLLPSGEEARVRDQFLLDQIRERARITWCQSDQWSRSEPTTYQSHFQGQRVNCEDRTIQRPASTTRKHKPQSNKQVQPEDRMDGFDLRKQRKKKKNIT